MRRGKAWIRCSARGGRKSKAAHSQRYTIAPLADSARYGTMVGGIEIAAAHRDAGGGGHNLHGRGALGGPADDLMSGGPMVGVTCAHVIAASDTDEVVEGTESCSRGIHRQVGRL